MNDTSHADKHLEPIAPKSGDPRFIAGSTGEFGQSKKIVQQDGPAYGGEPVKKNQNGNDKKQQNYGVTDANFTHTLGVIPDPDTGQPMSYAQTMQAYNAVGAIQSLAPDIYAKLVANQNAGLGTVQGGALAIMGITKTDGQGGKSLTGIDQAAISKMATMQLPGLGNVKDVVLSTTDFKGRAWNRAHHSLSSWNSMTDLNKKGWGWQDSALFTGDSMTSWAGRVSGMNNQDGDKTGFAADELAGLKYLTLVEQATGKPDILESVLMSHAATHLPEDQLTNPKINKYLGLPDDYRPKNEADIKMYAARLRQWAAQPGVEVNRGEFEKFVKKTPADIAGVLNASGLLNTVQFKPEEQHNHTAAATTNTNTTLEAPIVPTGVGTGTLDATALPADTTPLVAGTDATTTAADTTTTAGGGDTTTTAAGTDATDTTTTPAGTTDAGTGAVAVANPVNPRVADNTLDAPIAKANSVTHMANALISSVDATKGNTLSDADKALLYSLLMDVADGSSKSVLDDKDRKDPVKVADALKAKTKATKGAKAVADALADGKIDAKESAALSMMLDGDTAKALEKATQDGKVTPAELKDIKDKATKAADGADKKGLPADVQKALADGKLSAAERTALAKTLSPEDMKAVEAAAKDGKVSDTELAKLGATIAEKDVADAKAATPAGADDAKAGADAVGADGKPVDPTAADAKPTKDATGKDAKDGAKAATGKDKKSAAAADAKAAASAVVHPGVKDSSFVAPPGGDKNGSKPADGTKKPAAGKKAA